MTARYLPAIVAWRAPCARRREIELIANEDIEVVLLAAEREFDLHITHPNSFLPDDMLPT